MFGGLKELMMLYIWYGDYYTSWLKMHMTYRSIITAPIYM